MIVKLLTEHHLEFLSLKGGCTGSSESTLVKISNCWKSYAAAHMYMFQVFRLEDYACLYTLHGHTSSITALYLDKVTISSFLIFI